MVKIPQLASAVPLKVRSRSTYFFFNEIPIFEKILGDPCSLPVVIGTGTAQLTRYYYNSAIRQCASFIYSGLGGNENNFRSPAECQARCQTSKFSINENRIYL